MQKRLTIVVLSLLASTSVVLGDGGIFIRRATPKDILQPTQKVYVRWDGSQESLLIQTKYQGPAEEMVWIVPVPAKPEVELGDGAIFEELSKETAYADVSVTDFIGLTRTTAGAERRGRSDPVEWRQQIGAYDVVLLRPVGEEHAVRWLQANEFGIPDDIVPILEDYIRKQWWMIAARIHPDALTNITRENLAQGLLHPLALTFQTSACVYPMRLTSMAAGPVEELIYIEGPMHFEPSTLIDGNWELGIFGGPVRQVADRSRLSDLEIAVRTREGKTETTIKRYLTKLRRVFQPSEMTDDLVFREMNYATWVLSDDPSRIAQGATQYGRHRDPDGIPYLLAALSPAALDQVEPARGDYSMMVPPSAMSLSWQGIDRQTVACRHLRGCIWALGEIGIEHETGADVEAALLSCARHDNQLIRMEADVALIKLGSPRAGAVFADRVASILAPGFKPQEPFWYEGTILTAEMDTTIGWIAQFGAEEERGVLIAALAATIAALPTDSEYYRMTWPEWVVRQAASVKDSRLIDALDHLLAAISDHFVWTRSLIMRVQAMGGSAEAMNSVVADVIDNEGEVLQAGAGEGRGGYASLCGYYDSPVRDNRIKSSLRGQILEKREYRSGFYPLSTEMSDAVIRRALDVGDLTDWYALYLLATIVEPQAQDKNRLLDIFDRGDASIRMVAVDVLCVWNDVRSLFELYDATDDADARSEVAWALADNGVAEAVDLVEEQILVAWSREMAAIGVPLLDDIFLLSRSGTESPVADALRKSRTALAYFQPRVGTLDDDRMAALRRLAAATSVYAGLRFDLIHTRYGNTEWGKPLLEKAATDILSASLLDWIVLRVGLVVDNEFMADLCKDASSDEFRAGILNGLLSDVGSSLQPLIGTLLGQVWPQQYLKTGGESGLFREPGPLSDSMDDYALFNKNFAGLLESLVRDDSLPAGYRAFLLVHWSAAPARISRSFVESLLQADMPDFLRTLLSERLALEWTQN